LVEASQLAFGGIQAEPGFSQQLGQRERHPANPKLLVEKFGYCADATVFQAWLDHIVSIPCRLTT
jgi:hypothetical protein